METLGITITICIGIYLVSIPVSFFLTAIYDCFCYNHRGITPYEKMMLTPILNTLFSLIFLVLIIWSWAQYLYFISFTGILSGIKLYTYKLFKHYYDITTKLGAIIYDDLGIKK